MSDPGRAARARVGRTTEDSGEDGDEGIKKGMFDDFLSLEDRETGQTAITQGDKSRYEKARVAGDVSHCFQRPLIHFIT